MDSFLITSAIQDKDKASVLLLMTGPRGMNEGANVGLLHEEVSRHSGMSLKGYVPEIGM